MSESALEYYQKAYEAHYQEMDLPKAIALYKNIITHFPNSNECAYAAIQLEKITAGEISDEIKILSLKKIIPLFVVWSLLLLCCISALIWSFSKLITIENSVQEMNRQMMELQQSADNHYKLKIHHTHLKEEKIDSLSTKSTPIND